jgi:hypothetical protein
MYELKLVPFKAQTFSATSEGPCSFLKATTRTEQKQLQGQSKSNYKDRAKATTRTEADPPLREG